MLTQSVANVLQSTFVATHEPAVQSLCAKSCAGLLVLHLGVALARTGQRGVGGQGGVEGTFGGREGWNRGGFGLGVSENSRDLLSGPLGVPTGFPDLFQLYS